MKIYKVKIGIGRLTTNSIKVEEIECDEKGKTFLTSDNRRINKDGIMKLDSNFNQGLAHHQNWFTYCHYEQIDNAKIMLYSHVKSNLEAIQTNAINSLARLESINPLTPTPKDSI